MPVMNTERTYRHGWQPYLATVMTLQEAVERFDTTRARVRYDIKQGYLEADKSGGVWIITTNSLYVCYGDPVKTDDQRGQAIAREIARTFGTQGDLPLYWLKPE